MLDDVAVVVEPMDVDTGDPSVAEQVHEMVEAAPAIQLV